MTFILKGFLPSFKHPSSRFVEEILTGDVNSLLWEKQVNIHLIQNVNVGGGRKKTYSNSVF